MSPPAGEMDLPTLLSTMSPLLDPTTYVYVTTHEPLSAILPALQPKLLFQEPEGATVITTRDLAAAHGYAHSFACRMITLRIHSSLEAVGFMAAIAARLTEAGVSANVVSAFFHDHLFVPVGKEELAMEVLRELSGGAKGEV